jgi:hypothetical protein
MAEERPHILFGEELAAVRAEGLLEPYQRANILGVFVLAWLGGFYAGFFVDSLSMILNLILPWAAIAVAGFYPADFTLVPCFAGPKKRSAGVRYFHDSERVPPASLSIWWAVSLCCAVYPQYDSFIGSRRVFLVDGCFIAAALFGVSVIVIGTRDRRNKPLTWVRLTVLLLLSLPYGYGAAKQLNVLLDRSNGTTYQTRVVKHAFSPRRSPIMRLIVEPWGPVQDNPEARINGLTSAPYRVGGPICMTLRPGSLGVEWYKAEECPGP